MPYWLYQIRPLFAALLLIVFVESLALAGLILVRRFVITRFKHHEGTNDAVSGTVQAVGVFYGITIGLISVGVWNTNSEAKDLVSKEATSIGALHRDISGYPDPARTILHTKLREYTVFIIEQAWPAQRLGQGQTMTAGAKILDEFQATLYSFEPNSPGQQALHAETIKTYNTLIENRRLRIDAVNGGLSTAMWAVIWAGVAISISVAYFYTMLDPKLHAVLVSFMGGFLAILLFMIMVNDRPFYGQVAVSSDPYRLILNAVIDRR